MDDYFIRLLGTVHIELTTRTVLNSVLCGAIAGIGLSFRINIYFVYLFCCVFSGIISKTAIAPAERVKLTFQISKEKFTLLGALYRGLDIVKHGGIFQLWKGHSTTVLRVAPFAGISYAGHDYTEGFFLKHLNVQKLPILYQFLAGSVGGGVATLCTYPLDVLRIRLALIPNLTWSKALKQPGLFHGIAPTLLGIIPYTGTAWCVKQILNENFPSVVKRRPTVFESFVLNAIAGLMGQFVTYPLDVVRRRMQMHYQIHQTNPPSIVASLRYLFTTEGVPGMFKGYSLNIIKGPITLSLSLTTYDLLRGTAFQEEKDSV